jgi:hypothetical protein
MPKRSDPKKSAPKYPAPIDFFAPGASLSLEPFLRPEFEPRNPASRAFYRKGLERLIEAPVILALTPHRNWFFSGDDKKKEPPTLALVVSALGLAARLQAPLLKSLVCSVGALPENDGFWFEPAAAHAHGHLRFFRSTLSHYHEQAQRHAWRESEPPTRQIWADVAEELGVKKGVEVLHYLRPVESAGRNGWMMRSLVEWRGYYRELTPWGAGTAERVARALEQKGWGPVMPREIAADDNMGAILFAGYNSTDRYNYHEALRREFAPLARATAEATELALLAGLSGLKVPATDSATASADSMVLAAGSEPLATPTPAPRRKAPRV